ncbi:MAG: DsrE/DsrF/DrsH-like family protein [Thermodesulfobacterium sp.]|nr:DsrE/DsrF/DrsH-like family protein [Thermodesulfobacterium sp.]
MEKRKKVLLICPDNTLNTVYPALILSLQAARARAKSMVFFTFEGIKVILKGGAKKVKYYPKGFLGSIPGIPTLFTKLMIKMAEKRAGVPQPEDLLEICQLEGVKFYACLMTVQMMKLKKEDFIDGVEIIDAEGYMKLALDADINMFI